MDRLDGQHVLVGVGGSVAAYRACDVVRRLRELGASVRVAPTRAAAAFVAPLTFEALSGAPVLGGVLDVEGGKIPHIEEAYRSALVVVAPATADLIAKMAHGLADEALLATLLSYRGPLVVAPAMETRMWEHAATQQNVRTLVERGAMLCGPVDGPLASGRAGAGRLAAVDDIVEACVAALCHKRLAGRVVVITAGPTVEDIDPVRFLSNRSSGKMGVAIARAAAQRGAHVHLVHGPLKQPAPQLGGLSTHPVRSAAEMYARVHQLLGAGHVDIAVMSAAVADFTPAARAARKLKKRDLDGPPRIDLDVTKDILASVAALRGRSRPAVVVGFAAETHDVERYALEKLASKGCDLIVANDVAEAGSGFDGDDNRVFIADNTGGSWRERMSKGAVADALLDVVEGRLEARSTSAPPTRTNDAAERGTGRAPGSPGRAAGRGARGGARHPSGRR